MKKIARVSGTHGFTFERHLQDLYYESNRIDEQEIKPLLSRFELSGTAFSYTAPLFYVIDYTRAQYLVMSNGVQMIISRDPREFLDGGIPCLIDLYQQDDFKIYNEKVFPANMQFLKTQPQQEHKKFIFSYNFRVRHQKGHYVPILQHGSYITSKETGLPLYSLGMVVDISLVKKDRVIYHTIEKAEEQDGVVNRAIMQHNYFYPYEEDSLLSLHERRILEMLAGGSSSKQIADKLKISENTVANHRKNMLKKTNTVNVAELVAFACRTKLI